ncbi:MAG: HAD family hydrolase, partial [Thermodesulfobacteriota bacterium]|nr:HAD family hydrolase [Thermodesulfobacteriota bacterium]
VLAVLDGQDKQPLGNQMPYRLVIFDCDGVLFESRKANEAFYNHIRARFDLPSMNQEEIDFVHMSTAEESVNRIMPDEKTRAGAQAYRLTVDYTPFARLMVMEPSLMDLLRFLRPKFKTAVSTNRSSTINPILKDRGLAPFFDLVVSSQDVSHPKPNPESIFLILDRLNIPAGEALFVGDSEVDAATAAAAGVSLAAYKNPALPADFHIEDLGRIKAIVTGRRLSR